MSRLTNRPRDRRRYRLPILILKLLAALVALFVAIAQLFGFG